MCARIWTVTSLTANKVTVPIHMLQPHGILADGQERARSAHHDRLRGEVERELAEAMARAGWLKRIALRLRIEREVERRLDKAAPPDGLYGLSLATDAGGSSPHAGS